MQKPFEDFNRKAKSTFFWKSRHKKCIFNVSDVEDNVDTIWRDFEACAKACADAYLGGSKAALAKCYGKCHEGIFHLKFYCLSTY